MNIAESRYLLMYRSREGIYMKSASALPTDKLGSMLDKHGLEKTWKILIATHAAKGPYRVETKALILDSPEYAGVSKQEEDLLDLLSLGEIGILYEYSLARVNPDTRKEFGQYFTPDDVADWMASHVKEFPVGKWLDPCSGVGNLSYALVKTQEDPQDFILNRLLLADMDGIALLIARSLLTLMFHVDEPNFFQRIKKNFIRQDFLENPGKPELPGQVSQHNPDYVIVNPPYAASKDSEQVWDTHQARDLYAYFLERIIKTSKGFISVTPQSYTNSTKFRSLRELMLKELSQISIYNFDNVPDSIFRGIKFGSTNSNTANSVRASVVVAKKETPPDGKKIREITPLLRWLSADRKNMWKKLPTTLNDMNALSEELFPKNYSGLSQMYDAVRTPEWTPLKELLSNEETAYKLTVASTPRYYISATKRSLERSSFHVLYFRNKTDLEKAYLYLNSSLLYWWWRINDGGMTLSMGTLESFPIENDMPIDKKLAKSLSNKLTQSETDNLVSKQNSGKANENVKHPDDLIDELNNSLFRARTAAKLKAVQSNNDFGHDQDILRLFI